MQLCQPVTVLIYKDKVEVAAVLHHRTISILTLCRGILHFKWAILILSNRK